MDAQYVLLFLAVFMLHEFEEIIFVKSWVRAHRAAPRFANHIWVKQFGRRSLSTATFAALVAEEFIVIGSLCAVALAADTPAMFAGLMIAYGLHLVGHCADMIIRRSYVPGGLMAVLTLPVIAWLAYNVINQAHLSAGSVLAWTVGLGLLVLANLRMLYKLAPRIERFLH